MIVTTTSSIPNEEIKSIISVVHNRVVLGTNIFSDISASFSDFFGGNNSAYEKRLAEITDDVIDGLKKKALRLRAHALIDLKIDVDEVNGKNKSMFMVTAIATAVLIKNDSSKNNDNNNFDFISYDDLNNSILKNRIIKLAENDDFNPNTNWVLEYISNNEIIEVFENYINHINGVSKKIDSPVPSANWRINFNDYISNLKNNELHDATFGYFSKDKLSNREIEVLEIIFEKLEINYDKVYNYLLDKDKNYEKGLCLNILNKDKKIYTKNDLNLIVLILEKLKNLYPKNIEIEVTNGMFSKGEKIRKCICGSKVAIDINRFCQNCYLDEYGNRSYIVYADEIIIKLDEIVNTLNKIIK
jgi:uncharacterized protein YbjQ (UPF0145 family)